MQTNKELIKTKESKILKAVASSSAIESGESVQKIEERLLKQKSKFNHLQLAN